LYFPVLPIARENSVVGRVALDGSGGRQGQQSGANFAIKHFIDGCQHSIVPTEFYLMFKVPIPQQQVLNLLKAAKPNRSLVIFTAV
jgi:hypothetical protein